MSSGFVLPRVTGDVYMMQQHLGGAGINITSVSGNELHEMNDGYCRGILLTYDTSRGLGAIVSRIAIFRIEVDFNEAKKFVEKSTTKIRFEGLLRDISEIRELSIRAPWGAGIIHDWSQIKDFLEKTDNNGLEFINNASITGILQSPLRAG
jgi:hypothetical protein